MDSVQWSRREKSENATVMKLRRGDEVIAVEEITKEGSSGILYLGETDTWRVELAPDTGASATSGDGKRFSAIPEKQGTTFTKAKTFAVDAAGRAFRIENVAANNWVVEDSDGAKVGQFTGFHSGVRDVELDLSDCATATPLSAQETVFLAWLARIILENRLASRSTMIIATLVLLTIIAVAVFLF